MQDKVLGVIELYNWENTPRQFIERVTTMKINAAYTELLKVISGLEEEEFTQPLAPGKWPVRDLIAHLIYWNQLGLDFAREKLAGGNPIWPGYDFDKQNQKAAQQWSGLTPAQLLQKLDRIRQETIDLVEEIGPAGLKKQWRYEGGSSEVGEFINSFAHHQLHHCKQIREWRTSKPGQIVDG